MKKTFLLLSAALMACSAFAQEPEKEVINLDVDVVDAALYDSYDGTNGQWHLQMSKDAKPVAIVQIFSPSPYTIAGTYFDLGNETVVTYNGEQVEITEGSCEVTYISKGEENPLYHISANLETETQIFMVDITTEVLAYDALYYYYYTCGQFNFEQCLITLGDGNEEGELKKVVIDKADCIDFIEMYRVIQINSASEDGLYTQFLLDAINLHVIDGQYEMSKGYASRCWLADASNGTYVAHFTEGVANVYVTSPETLHIECEFKAVGGDIYHMIIEEVKCPGAEYDPNGINNVITDASFLAGKKLQGGKVTIERNGVKYGVNGAVAE